MHEILLACATVSEFLSGLVTDLARYAEVGRALGGQSEYLRDMGNEVRLFALNAQIGASRLGDQGAALDAVARLLTEQSQATSPLVAAVAEHAAAAVEEIEEMTFQVALSTVQAEMIAVFAHELAEAPEVEQGTAVNMLALSDALRLGLRADVRLPADGGSSAQRRGREVRPASRPATTVWRAFR